MYVQRVSARYIKDDPSIHPGHLHLHPHQQELSHASAPSPLEQTLLSSQSPPGPWPSCRSGQSPQSVDGPCMALSHRRSRETPERAELITAIPCLSPGSGTDASGRSMGVGLSAPTARSLSPEALSCIRRSTLRPPLRHMAGCDPVMASAVRQGLSDIQSGSGVPKRVAISRCPTITWLPHGTQCPMRCSGAVVNRMVDYNQGQRAGRGLEGLTLTESRLSDPGLPITSECHWNTTGVTPHVPLKVIFSSP